MTAKRHSKILLTNLLTTVSYRSRIVTIHSPTNNVYIHDPKSIRQITTLDTYQPETLTNQGLF